MLEEEPETADNAARLKDDKAQVLLWLYICTLEKNLQTVGATGSRSEMSPRSKSLADVKFECYTLSRSPDVYVVSSCPSDWFRPSKRTRNGRSCEIRPSVWPIPRPTTWTTRTSRRPRTAAWSTRACSSTWQQKAVGDLLHSQNRVEADIGPLLLESQWKMYWFSSAVCGRLLIRPCADCFPQSSASPWREHWTSGPLSCRAMSCQSSAVPSRATAPSV